jgi:hypothetical protein
VIWPKKEKKIDKVNKERKFYSKKMERKVEG